MPPTEKRTSRLILSLLALSLVFPLSALVGWSTGVWIVGKLAPQSIPMAPMTAILLSFMAVIMGLQHLRPHRETQTSWLSSLASFVMISAGFILSVHVFHLNTDVENIFTKSIPFDTNVVAGRMSPLTAFNILLDSTALFFLLDRNGARRQWAGYFAAASLAICSTTLLGYIYGTPLLYGGKTIPMAHGTAFTLLCLDVVLLLLGDKKDFPKKLFYGESLTAQLTRAFLPMTVGAVVTSSFILATLTAVWGVNPALSAVATAMTSAILTVIIIVRVARVLGEKLERVDALEASLALSNRKFGTFMQNGPFAAFIRDQNGQSLFGNSISTELFENQNLELETIRYELSTKDKVEHEVQIKKPTGETSHWHIIHFNIPTDNIGKLIGGIGIDITKIKQAEEDREKAQRQLRLSYKMAALGEMSGSIAHEINNPIAIILGKSRQINELLKEEPVHTEMVKKFAIAIDETARRIASIVHGLRTISRQAHNDNFISAGVMNIVDGTIAITVGRFREKNVELKIDPCAETVLLDCQPAQIAQVLLNLLNNAFDAVEDLTEKWVHLAITADKTDVVIRVSDSGVKIPTEIRAQMFSPFFTTKAVGRGTGLGLSISTNIIQTHGGSLTLDEEMPHTSFIIRLPLKKTSKA